MFDIYVMSSQLFLSKYVLPPLAPMTATLLLATVEVESCLTILAMGR